jgi:hypothetical protein
MTITQPSAITIFVIATNSYVDYALNLIKSSSRWVESGTQIQFLLLTDSEIDMRQFDLHPKSITVNSFQIPSYGWPEATLMRFHLMVDHWEQALYGSGIVVAAVEPALESEQALPFPQPPTQPTSLEPKDCAIQLLVYREQYWLHNHADHYRWLATLRTTAFVMEQR